jgi:2-iminobutanoate/2-iminopropanoate deaminase
MTARSSKVGSVRRESRPFPTCGAHSDLDHVAKVTIFLTSMAKFTEVVELRRKYFSEPYPADTIVEIEALYTPEAMIEIEAIAAVATNKDG